MAMVQLVVHGGFHGRLQLIDKGVPQASILGLLIFPGMLSKSQ